jgi:hypothetical protein
MLRGIPTLLLLIALSTPGLGQGAKERTTDEDRTSNEMRPWEIEAVFKSEKFDRCLISRKTDDDIVVRFLRTSDGLSLELESSKWKLDAGERYPVRMRAGSSIWETRVAAQSNSVSVTVSDTGFRQHLRTANTLSVEGAGATIRAPLDGSRVALDRLETCFEKNSRAIETNPFVKPNPQP